MALGDVLMSVTTFRDRILPVSLVNVVGPHIKCISGALFATALKCVEPDIGVDTDRPAVDGRSARHIQVCFTWGDKRLRNKIAEW